MVLTFISDFGCCFFVLHYLVYFEGYNEDEDVGSDFIGGSLLFSPLSFAFFFVNLLDNVACVGVGVLFPDPRICLPVLCKCFSAERFSNVSILHFMLIQGLH
jgi:hypothetical protein